MRLWCKAHSTHLSPLPSGYHAPSAWRCPGGETVTASDLEHAGISPAQLGVVVHHEPAKGRTRLVGV